MLQIELNALENSWQNLLRALRATESEYLEFNDIDFYWSIDPDELYHPYQRPATLTLGQISDDLQETSSLADGYTDATAPYLAKVCAILEAVGHGRYSRAAPAPPAPMRLRLTQLDRALQRLFAAMRKGGEEVIQLHDVNLYWSVSPAELYNPYEEPTELSLGQLQEDWTRLDDIATGAAAPTREDLLSLSAVLTVIGYRATEVFTY